MQSDIFYTFIKVDITKEYIGSEIDLLIKNHAGKYIKTADGVSYFILFSIANNSDLTGTIIKTLERYHDIKPKLSEDVFSATLMIHQIKTSNAGFILNNDAIRNIAKEKMGLCYRYTTCSI